MASHRRLFLAPAAFALGLAAVPFACTPDQLGTGAGGAAGGVATSSGGAGGGCVEPGTECPVLFTYPLGGEHSVDLRGDFAPDGWTKGVHMSLDGAQWRATIEAKDGQSIQYKFFVDGTTWVTDPNNMNTVPDGQGGVNDVLVASCPGTKCAPDAGNPDASPPPGEFDWRSAYLYFVFVDRFNNGDTSNDAPIPGIEAPANYEGGDYKGVTQKIASGYFDDLGVNALWITVPMDNTSDSGHSADPNNDPHQYSAYHGYWPQNLDKPEEHFGDMATLKKLVSTAHQHGIKVLFDYAMNHVHISAPVYAQHPDWFWPLDYNGKTCVCGGGCDWNDPYEQKRCWFTDYLPDWNFTNTQARAFSVDNAIWWVDQTGIDGFRLDAVKHIETVWISDLRTRVTNEIEKKSHQHFYMVGETFESGNRDLIKSYVDPSNLLDGQFDFPLRGQVVSNILSRNGTMFDLDGFLASNDAYYDPGVMSTFLGNHDLLRTIMTALDQPWDLWNDGGIDAKWNNPPFQGGSTPPRSAYERMGVAFTFLLTTKGIPLLYYGDEIGMPGAGDPDNRRFMQWSNYTPDQLFLRGTLQKLGQARKKHPALWKGIRTTKSVTNDTYGYQMTAGNDSMWVALNRGDQTAAVDGMPAKGKDLLTGQTVQGPQVNLPPRTSMVIVAE